MGTVHLGRVVGAGGFSRVVAVKKLFPGFASDRGFRQMLLDEARLAARIRHPNVVPTLDVVESDAELTIVMEYVHGLSLAEVVEQCEVGEPMPVDVALGIVQAFLLGLHAAHEARGEDGAPLGIVHRDVSPQNVLVGADGVPRLIDFGIAKAATRIQVTDPGTLKGKAAYMAPEQLAQEPVSRLADVFSSSVVLWELLANRPLFADAEIASRVRTLRDEPPPPSRFREGLDPALDAIVLRGLAREPSHRFATAQAMAVALSRAGRVASPVEIARWVTAHAADELEISEERVRLFEQTPHEGGTTSPAVVASVPEATRSTSRGWLPLAGVAVLVALGVLAVRAASSRGDGVAATGSAPSAAAIASTAAPLVTAQPAVIAPTPAASVEPPSSATTTAAPSASPARPAGVSSGTRPARARPGKHACDPPYTVDSSGFKHYDPACF